MTQFTVLTTCIMIFFCSSVFSTKVLKYRCSRMYHSR